MTAPAGLIISSGVLLKYDQNFLPPTQRFRAAFPMRKVSPTMIKRTLLLFTFVMSTATQAQTPYPSSGSTAQDIGTLLGAISGAKIYAERCFSVGGITSRQGIEGIAMRLRSYEKIEIEIHYYMIREAMKIEKQSSVDAAENIQQWLLKTRQEFAASIDPKTLPVACSNFATNITTRTGDFKYMYAIPLKAIRDTQ